MYIYLFLPPTQINFAPTQILFDPRYFCWTYVTTHPRNQRNLADSICDIHQFDTTRASRMLGYYYI